jgi:hypothetical protein
MDLLLARQVRRVVTDRHLQFLELLLLTLAAVVVAHIMAHLHRV